MQLILLVLHVVAAPAGVCWHCDCCACCCTLQEVLAEFDAAHALAAELQRMVDGEGEEEQDANAAEQQKDSQQHSQQLPAQPLQRQLWVDKYAPQGYLSLLSEPRINREIAAWVAKWNRDQQQQGQQQMVTTATDTKQAIKQQQQQQQQGSAAGRGRGDGGGRAGAAAGRGRGGGKAEGRSGSTAGCNIVRGFDAARYQAAKEARAAARVLLLVGPPGG
jgi:hypothetical protein